MGRVPSCQGLDSCSCCRTCGFAVVLPGAALVLRCRPHTRLRPEVFGVLSPAAGAPPGTIAFALNIFLFYLLQAPSWNQHIPQVSCCSSAGLPCSCSTAHLCP